MAVVTVRDPFQNKVTFSLFFSCSLCLSTPSTHHATDRALTDRRTDQPKATNNTRITHTYPHIANTLCMWIFRNGLKFSRVLKRKLSISTQQAKRDEAREAKTVYIPSVHIYNFKRSVLCDDDDGDFFLFFWTWDAVQEVNRGTTWSELEWMTLHKYTNAKERQWSMNFTTSIYT